MSLAPVKEWTRETLYQDVKFCCTGGTQVYSKGKNVCHENNQVEVNLINSPLWLFLFLQIDRKWNFREKCGQLYQRYDLWCACAHELKDTETTLIRRHTHIHAQLRIILGCGPNANLKSTNTHGTQQKAKETEQGGQWLLSLDRGSALLYSEVWTGPGYRHNVDREMSL